jgi:predicted nucleic acid-binding protein
MYFDSAYLFKCYIDDADSRAVRRLAGNARVVYSSALCIAELACAIQRAVRERALRAEQASAAHAAFRAHVREGFILLIPVTESILYSVQARVSGLPPGVFIRSGDALHLATAEYAGFSEVWTNDRHMLNAASHFGVKGRTISKS